MSAGEEVERPVAGAGGGPGGAADADAGLAEVRVERYGALVGADVPLGPGVTVVVGANEAGKSTFLSALGDLLWGLPLKSPLYPLASRSTVRLAATLADGRRVVRTNRGLLGPDALTAVPSPWGEDQRASWGQGFGLDHAGLREGGRSVFAGRGDLAELVFTARSGQGAGAVLAALRARADSLYRPHRGATTVEVRTARAHLDAVRTEVATATTRASLVTAAEHEVAAAVAALERAGAAEADADREHRRRQREAAALTEAAALRAVRADLAALEDEGRALEPSTLAAWEEADARRAAAVQERAGLEEASARWRADVAGLSTEPALLGDADAVGALHAQAQAREADAVRAAELDAAAAGHADRAAAAAAAADLAGPTRLPADLGAQLDAAAAEHADLARADAETRSRLAAAHDALRALESAGALPDPAALAPLAARADALGGDEGPARRWREAVAAAEGAAAACEAHLREAGVLDVPGALAAFRTAPPTGAPGVEEVAAAAAALQDAATARAEAARDAERAADRGRRAREVLDGLEVPAVDAAAVAALREERQLRWEALLAADGLLDLGERASYQDAVRAADEGADALVAGVGRTAAHDAARRQVDEVAGEERRTADALEACEARERDARDGHDAVWGPAGVEVPGAGRAEAVRRALVAAALSAASAREHDQAAARAASEVAAGARDLAALLAAAGTAVPHGEDVAALGAALSAAAALVRAADEAREARAARAGAAAEVGAAEAARERAASALGAWARRWSVLLEAAGLPGVLDVAGWGARRRVAAVVEEARERAAQVLAEAERAAGAWRGFADAVAEVARRHGEGGEGGVGGPAGAGTVPADEPADEPAATLAAVARLQDRLEVARADAATLAEREARLDEASGRLEGLAVEVERADADAARALSSIDAGPGTDGGVDVGVLVGRSRAVAALRAREADLLARLSARTVPGAEDVDGLLAALDGVDDVLAEQRLAEAARHEREAESERSAAAEDLGSARARLQALTRGSDAAGLRAREAQALAALAEVTERYAIAHLQRTVLREQLQAHAARHASPLLADAGHVLEVLTGGRWVALVATEASTTERSLGVVDAAGADHEPSQLSEGTADQVFLALRLAGIAQVAGERAARGLPALPVVLDDVLMTFDDVRAAATLRLLAGRDQQVVVLTHHDHVGALAASLDHERIGVARLPAPPAGVEAGVAATVRSAATRRRAEAG